MIVAIDGPAGSGKSTTAKRVAVQMGYLHIDTGAMFRAVTYAAIESGIPAKDEALAGFLERIPLVIEVRGADFRVMLDRQDISAAIRTPEVGALVSDYAQLPAVRAYLLGRQRKLGYEAKVAGSGAVLEGRDIGSVVFPDADVKVFLQASKQTRAARRFAELARKGVQTTEAAVLAELEDRDQKDAARAHAPLVMPAGAVVVDTTDVTIDEQVAIVVRLIREALPEPVEPTNT